MNFSVFSFLYAEGALLIFILAYDSIRTVLLRKREEPYDGASKEKFIGTA